MADKICIPYFLKWKSRSIRSGELWLSAFFSTVPLALRYCGSFSLVGSMYYLSHQVKLHRFSRQMKGPINRLNKTLENYVLFDISYLNPNLVGNLICSKICEYSVLRICRLRIPIFVNHGSFVQITSDWKLGISWHFFKNQIQKNILDFYGWEGCFFKNKFDVDLEIYVCSSIVLIDIVG